MVENHRETGARILKDTRRPDETDTVSQKAAENKKPDPGSAGGAQAERDARGQSEDKHKGGTNDGMVSADPRPLSEKESGDATFPLDQSER